MEQPRAQADYERGEGNEARYQEALKESKGRRHLAEEQLNLIREALKTGPIRHVQYSNKPPVAGRVVIEGDPTKVRSDVHADGTFDRQTRTGHQKYVVRDTPEGDRTPNAADVLKDDMGGRV